MSKKQQILDAFLDKISEGGFYDSSMREIADIADVAVGTIYIYFKDKQDLIAALYDEWSERRANILREGDDSSLATEKRLKNLWELLFKLYTKNPKGFEFLELHKHSPVYALEVREKELQSLDPIITSFERGIAKGDYRYMNPVAMLYLLFGHVAACARLHLAGKVDVSQYQMDVLKQSCWDSLRAMKY